MTLKLTQAQRCDCRWTRFICFWVSPPLCTAIEPSGVRKFGATKRQEILVKILVFFSWRGRFWIYPTNGANLRQLLGLAWSRLRWRNIQLLKKINFSQPNLIFKTQTIDERIDHLWTIAIVLRLASFTMCSDIVINWANRLSLPNAEIISGELQEVFR